MYSGGQSEAKLHLCGGHLAVEELLESEFTKLLSLRSMEKHYSSGPLNYNVCPWFLTVFDLVVYALFVSLKLVNLIRLFLCYTLNELGNLLPSLKVHECVLKHFRSLPNATVVEFTVHCQTRL